MEKKMNTFIQHNYDQRTRNAVVKEKFNRIQKTTFYQNYSSSLHYQSFL